ncbi:MAG: hypothetical protein ABSG05_03485 [Candidatus Pacearchaeota archaeon]|jgi:hypothetical protein
MRFKLIDNNEPADRRDFLFISAICFVLALTVLVAPLIAQHLSTQHIVYQSLIQNQCLK